jgi:hypothetical protein
VAWILALVAFALLGVAGYAGYRVLDARSQQPPQRIVVIGESELEDGTTVAGLIAVVDASGSALEVRGLDSSRKVSIPGTSYSRLREALAVGDADLVARLATNDEDAEWVLLSEAEWSSMLERGGGFTLEIPGTATVFTGNRLFRFAEGEQSVGGDAAAALVRGSELLGDSEKGGTVRVALSAAVGSAVLSQADSHSLEKSVGAEISNPRRVDAFLSQGR